MSDVLGIPKEIMEALQTQALALGASACGVIATADLVIEERFAVTGTRPAPVQPAPATVGGDAGTAWLDELPTDEVRAVFRHLASHGAVTEGEAAEMLGGQRALRRFALRVEEYATRAPFAVRIDVVAGVKRYVREGTAR